MGAKKSKKKAKRSRPASSRETVDPLESATSSPTLVDHSDSATSTPGLTPEPEVEMRESNDKENVMVSEESPKTETSPTETSPQTVPRPSVVRENSFARFTTFPERPNVPATSYVYEDDDEVVPQASFEPMEPEVEESTQTDSIDGKVDSMEEEEFGEMQEAEPVVEEAAEPAKPMEEMQMEEMEEPTNEVTNESVKEPSNESTDDHTSDPTNEPAQQMEEMTVEPMVEEEAKEVEAEVDVKEPAQAIDIPEVNGHTDDSELEEPATNHICTPADPVAPENTSLTMMAPEPESYESNSHQFSDYSRMSPTEDDIQSLNADLDTTVPSFFKKRNSSTSSRTSIPIVEVEKPEEAVEEQEEQAEAKQNNPLSPTLELALSPVSTPLRTPSPTKSPRTAGLSPVRTPLHLSAAVRSMSPSSSNMEIRPFEKRFETRISSLLKRSGHSRSGSELTSRGSPNAYASPRHLTSLSDSLATDSMSWTKLHNISNQIYSEAGQLEFGEPSALLVTNTICVGTKNGVTLVFDYQQNMKKALSYIKSPVTCLAVSSDATFLAVGHESGHVITWDLNSLKHDLVIAPEMKNTACLSIAFVGKRHSCVVSGNSAGKAYLHDGYTGITGRKTRSACIMGQNTPSTGAKPTTIFACSSLPLGSVSSVTDELGLVAIMTPHILAIISTTPTVMTQFKIGRPKNTNPTLGFMGTLVWYPAVRSSTSVIGSDKPILAYSWANVVTILEIQSGGASSGFGKKLKFSSIARHTTSESIVSIQWINRQVLGLVTATQSLLIMSFANGELQLSATVDLLSKHVLKFDRYSRTLGQLRISRSSKDDKNDDDDDNSVPVVPLDSYASTVCTFKGRIFLLGCYELVVGYTLSWYDKVEILVKQEQYLNAVKLALAYYESASGDGVVVGLPVEDSLRKAVVKPAILEVIQMVLPRALRAETSLDLAELTSICVDALINMGDNSMDSTIYDLYEDSDHLPLYLDTIAMAVFDLRLRSVSPRVFKGLIATYSATDESTDKMEEIICTLDPATLDVDTTLGLCMKYGLLDASIYIWNVALNDYISPLSEFFQAIVSGDESGIANRVYSYLSYIFSGRIYPTGLKMRTAQTEIEAKSSLYYVLLIGNFIVWPKVGGRKIPSLVSTDEYPYLKSLITFNPASFYVALDEAFEDHFLNDNVEHAETQIDEHFFQQGGASLNGATSAQFSEEVSFGRNINRQMIVDVLLQIAPELSPECHVYTLIFIARNYPKYSQFIMLGEGILKSILEHLCVGAPRELRQECELAAEVLISKFRPFDLQWTISLLSEAGYNGALSYIYRTERLFPKLVDHAFATELFDDIFEVVEKSFEETSGSSGKAAKDRSKIEESVKASFEQLIRLSPSRTVSLVSEWCPRLHSVILDSGIESDQQLLYLKSYFHSLRVSGSESPKSAFWGLYITLLAQSKEDVLDQLETEVSALDFDDNVIESVASVLQSTDNIESLVILLQKKKRYDEALDHLLREINEKEAGDHVNRLIEVGALVCDKDETLWNKFLSNLKSEDAIAQGFKQLSTDLVSYRLVHKILLHQKHTSARVVKSVVLGVTDNYKFKFRFLQLTKEILDANTYALMMKDLEKQRLRGWKVGSANCDACGKPIYGKGIDGVTLYKAWQQAKIRGREGKMVFKNKGKENCDGERIDGQLTERVVVFKCGHVFHLGCMHRLGMVDEIGCLICEATEDGE
ncbi:Vacuolar protein sorting-associated protein 8 [Yarrowia sp. B02]|nr:Vacuolar protein sorting-associated protein 8 [Yarrowia sp. B02]